MSGFYPVLDLVDPPVVYLDHDHRFASLQGIVESIPLAARAVSDPEHEDGAAASAHHAEHEQGGNTRAAELDEWDTDQGSEERARDGTDQYRGLQQSGKSGNVSPGFDCAV